MIDWIKKTFENKEGKPCSKRITTFAFVVLFIGCAIHYMWGTENYVYRWYTLVLIAGVISLLLGIVTVENILKLIQTLKGNKPD